MTIPDGRPQPDEVADYLRSIHDRGIILWSEAGQLRFKGPKGSLTNADLGRLRELKGPINAYLQSSPTTLDAPNLPGSQLRRKFAPLAFTQLAQWHREQLGRRPRRRSIASVNRLRGCLNLEALCRSFTEVVRRHDALRTRIVVEDGVPKQVIDEPARIDVPVCDLSALAARDHMIEIQVQISKLVLEPVDLAEGPLIAVRLLRLGADEHVLLVAMEHIISDFFSMRVLLQDLFAAYGHLSESGSIRWATTPLQFSEYATRQSESLATWRQRHWPYWSQRLQEYQRLTFPGGHSTSRTGWGTVSLRIGTQQYTALRDWCRERATTMAMSVLSVYAAWVMLWCSAARVVIQCESHGRLAPDMECAIGYFASRLYVVVELLERDTFATLLERVTQEYWEAYEHQDFSYIAAQTPPPAFTFNTVFNWIPRGVLEPTSSGGSLRVDPIDFINPWLMQLDWDHEPTLVLHEAADEITGDIHFPLSRVSTEVMERFSSGFLLCLGSLVRHPEMRVKDLAL